jgi:hypothetical protein
VLLLWVVNRNCARNGETLGALDCCLSVKQEKNEGIVLTLPTLKTLVIKSFADFAKKLFALGRLHSENPN